MITYAWDKKLRICLALLWPPQGPFLSTFLGNNAFCRRKCPARKRPVSSVRLQLPFPLRPFIFLLYPLGCPFRTGTLMQLGLQRYLILTDLKPLRTERRPQPAFLPKLLLLTRLNLADSPSSVLAARYPCLSSQNLKGLRHYLSLGLAPPPPQVTA
jgi:hypothetical protein